MCHWKWNKISKNDLGTVMQNWGKIWEFFPQTLFKIIKILSDLTDTFDNDWIYQTEKYMCQFLKKEVLHIQKTKKLNSNIVEEKVNNISILQITINLCRWLIISAIAHWHFRYKCQCLNFLRHCFFFFALITSVCEFVCFLIWQTPYILAENCRFYVFVITIIWFCPNLRCLQTFIFSKTRRHLKSGQNFPKITKKCLISIKIFF